LLVSAAVILLCMTIVVGMTWALFTDTKGVANHLRAGDLSITLKRTELTKKMLRTLFKNKAADTVAHPFTGQYLVKKMGWDYDTLGKAWSDNELGDILKEGFDSGCAWEINTVSVHNDPQLVRRIYNIGKEIGVVFTLGTDAHKLLNVDPKNFIDEIKKVLY
jgi:predicted ribosomally synthesized peptide with SipW-like signal peptide